ncbi:hypothetical protein F2Q69_00031039 [Brassica cretica]|uniref:Uncharacterized protein n=1 Tax=Brassica cretica TaxID=69181 RepID=A0A8S9RYK2_BRACR|nr:hypothetical protein F2Q69_00031039 [Brassica cretica]
MVPVVFGLDSGTRWLLMYGVVGFRLWRSLLSSPAVSPVFSVFTPVYPGLFGFLIYDSSLSFIHLSFDLGTIVLPLLWLRFWHLQAYSYHKRCMILMMRLIGSLENDPLQMDLLSIRRSVGLTFLYFGCSFLSLFSIFV